MGFIHSLCASELTKQIQNKIIPAPFGAGISFYLCNIAVERYLRKSLEAPTGGRSISCVT